MKSSSLIRNAFVPAVTVFAALCCVSPGLAQERTADGYLAMDIQKGDTLSAIVLRATRNATNWQKDWIIVVDSTGSHVDKTEKKLGLLWAKNPKDLKAPFHRVLIRLDEVKTYEFEFEDPVTVAQVCETKIEFTTPSSAEACLKSLSVINELQRDIPVIALHLPLEYKVKYPDKQ